jgi:hypothetical protein
MSGKVYNLSHNVAPIIYNDNGNKVLAGYHSSQHWQAFGISKSIPPLTDHEVTVKFKCLGEPCMMRLILKGDDGNMRTARLAMMLDDNRSAVFLETETGIDYSKRHGWSIESNKWYILRARISGSKITFYLNDTEMTQLATTAAVSPNTIMIDAVNRTLNAANLLIDDIVVTNNSSIDEGNLLYLAPLRQGDRPYLHKLW